MKPLDKESWEKLKKDENLLIEIRKILKVNNSQITERIKKLISENEELSQKLKQSGSG